MGAVKKKGATSTERTIRRLQDDWRKWLADPRRDTRERSLGLVQKDLRSDKPGWRGSASVSPLNVASWHGIHGASAVLDGDTENGWRELDLSFQYEVAAARIPFGHFLPDRFGKTLAAAITYRDDASAEAVVAALTHVARQFEVFKVFRFPVFALRLWERRTGKSVDLHQREVPDLGVYRSILEAWDDDARVSALLLEACEFHMDNAYDTGGGYPEFLGAAYPLLPVDILSIVEVRSGEGRATGIPDHPLMTLPLASVPPPADRPRADVPDIVKKVLEKAAKEDAAKPA